MLRGRWACTALLKRGRADLQQACHSSNKASRKSVTTPIVLREDNVNLGPEGKLVRVKPGYARNHLVPSRQAVLATPANRTAFERKDAGVADAQLSQAAEAALQAAREQQRLALVMKRLMTGAVNMERELAPDLLPPVAWSEKQRLLTKLVQPVTPVEICAAINKQKRIHVAAGVLAVPGGQLTQTGDYLIPLRMLDPNGEQPCFTLTIVPGKPSAESNAEDGA